jgi:hypothetical protein
VTDPGQRGELGLAAEHQVGERPSAQAARDDAVACEAARPAEAGSSVEVDAHAPVAGRREGTAPAVRDPDALEHGEPGAQRALDARERARIALAVLVQRAAEVVGRAGAAERDPAVRRPLAVPEHVPLVGHRLAAGPADLVPERCGQRLRGEHVRVDREEASLLAGELRRERLGRPDHDLRAQRAVLGVDTARAERQRPRTLVDDHAAALGRGRQPARERSGVHASAVRGERSPEDAGDAHAVADLLRGDEPDVLLPQTAGPPRPDADANALELRG